MEQIARFRAATADDDGVIAQHFYQLWRDNQVPDDGIVPNWRDLVLDFIAQARRDLHYQAFVVEVESQVVGSAGGQLYAGLYPLALTHDYRRYGYIWGVYVEAPYRRQGLASQLTQMTVDHLRSLGCTRILLHASPSGQPVYSRLGFTESNEMRLDLSERSV